MALCSSWRVWWRRYPTNLQLASSRSKTVPERQRSWDTACLLSQTTTAFLAPTLSRTTRLSGPASAVMVSEGTTTETLPWTFTGSLIQKHFRISFPKFSWSVTFVPTSLVGTFSMRVLPFPWEFSHTYCCYKHNKCNIFFTCMHTCTYICF